MTPTSTRRGHRPRRRGRRRCEPDVDAEAADHDVDADQEAGGDHELGGAGFGWHDALSFFGVGRVPLMVVWVTFFIFAGFNRNLRETARCS